MKKLVTSLLATTILSAAPLALAAEGPRTGGGTGTCRAVELLPGARATGAREASSRREQARARLERRRAAAKERLQLRKATRALKSQKGAGF